MLVTLQNVMVYIGLIMFGATVANYTIVVPIKASIGHLDNTTRRLEDLIKILEGQVACQATQIARLEESVSSAHKRIDRVERECGA